MKTKLYCLMLFAVGSLLMGCQTSAALNQIHIGMSKDQVVSVLGQPDSMSAQANVEYMTYYLTTESGYGRDQPYMVRLVNGKVESFGRFAQLFDLYNRPVTSSMPGDPGFPAPGLAGLVGAPSAIVAPAGVPDLAGQIQKLKALRDSGAITDEEFTKAKAKLLGTDK